ncbi:hypothetical protein [uncultured Sphingomonas sp.]|nr:hypothetical protein [uncultured Sphingomonas sp.]
MPRPILILLIAAVVLIGLLFVLASFDREQPVSRMELPVTNAVAR